jgi:hypothetical protein
LLLIKRDASSGWSVEQKQNLAEEKKTKWIFEETDE